MKRKFTIVLLFHYLYYSKLLISKLFSTFYCRTLFRILGITLKEGSEFFGIPLVYIHPGSKVTIGKNIKIRTSKISNLIGIKQRTTISTISEHAEIKIGDNCGFTAVVIGAAQSIVIGNNVLVGSNVLITDTDWHSLKGVNRELNFAINKPVNISDNVFIGYSSTILKGVSIGKNSVIGANSVVTKDIPADVIAAGNPCKVLKPL